jgi:exosome complex component RRP41
MSLRLTPHNTADGSSTVQQGLTTVTATVFGPREPKQRGQSNHDRANLVVDVGVAAWAQQGANRKARGDKWVQGKRRVTFG